MIATAVHSPIFEAVQRAITDLSGGFNPRNLFAAIINDAGELAPYVTFTRSSTATYFGSDGLMKTAAANEPRYDYDPVTLQLRGLLIEEQRTNLLLDSASLATQSRAVTAVAHTLSFYGTGTVTLSGASTAGPLVGTGANNRVTLTFTPTAGALTLTVSGTVSNAQLEAGAFATSYIPTTTAAVTRAADVSSISSLSSIGFNASEGTVFGEASILAAGASGNKKSIFSLTPGNFNAETRGVLFNATTFTFGVADSALGGNQADLTSNVTGVSGFKFSSCYKENDFASTASGQAPAADTSGGVTSGIGYFNVGCAPQNSSGATNTKGDFLNGHIRRLRYYNRRLSNAQLQEMTA